MHALAISRRIEINTLLLKEGKPTERWGRKASGLRDVTKTAGPPKMEANPRSRGCPADIQATAIFVEL